MWLKRSFESKKYGGYNQIDALANSIGRTIFDLLKRKGTSPFYESFRVNNLNIVLVYDIDATQSDFTVPGAFRVSSIDVSEVGIKSHEPYIVINVTCNKDFWSLQNRWEDLNFEIKNTVRHELEHSNQYKHKMDFGKNISSITNENFKDYYLSEHEIASWASAAYFSATKKRVPIEQEIEKKLGEIFLYAKKRVSLSESALWQIIQQIRDKWIEYIYYRYPEAWTK